jgi:hypothetical protein
MNARPRNRLASNLKIDAGASARTSPWRNFGMIKLRQKLECLWFAVSEHPSHESPFMIRELSVIVAHCSSEHLAAELIIRLGSIFGIKLQDRKIFQSLV